MTRGAFTNRTVSAIAAARQVPVLVVEPSGAVPGDVVLQPATARGLLQHKA